MRITVSTGEAEYHVVVNDTTESVRLEVPSTGNAVVETVDAAGRQSHVIAPFSVFMMSGAKEPVFEFEPSFVVDMTAKGLRD